MKRTLPGVFTAICVIVVAMSFAPPAKADVIVYSNIDSSTVFPLGFGIGNTNPSDQALATPFVSSGDFLFTGVRIPLGLNRGTPAADVYLMSDAGGKPGAVLEELTAIGLLPLPGSLFTLTSSLQLELQAGVTYWLAVTPVDANSDVSWRRNTIGEAISASNVAITTSLDLTGSWSFVPANSALLRPGFEVDGMPVPEPGTLPLLLLGLLAVTFVTHGTRRFLA
jgi:hypothetical protein